MNSDNCNKCVTVVSWLIFSKYGGDFDSRVNMENHNSKNNEAEKGGSQLLVFFLPCREPQPQNK